MMIELKPCPICGGEAIIKKIPHVRGGYYVKCNDYKCPVFLSTNSYDIGEQAAEDWNERISNLVVRKHGEWIGFPESFKLEHIYDRDAIVCPFCEESWNIVDNDTERFNFCPNCGADMREEREV